MITLFFEAPIAEGKLSDVKAAMSALVESTKAEDGVLSYEFYVDHDESRFIGLERYRDAAALGAHAAALGEHGLDDLMAALAAPPSMTLFGVLPDELKAAFEGMGARFTTHIGGFTR